MCSLTSRSFKAAMLRLELFLAVTAMHNTLFLVESIFTVNDSPFCPYMWVCPSYWPQPGAPYPQPPNTTLNYPHPTLIFFWGGAVLGGASNACLPPIRVRKEVWLGLGGFQGPSLGPELAALRPGRARVPRPHPTLAKPCSRPKLEIDV